MSYIKQSIKNKNVQINLEINTEMPLRSGWYKVIGEIVEQCENLANECQSDYDIKNKQLSPVFKKAKDGIKYLKEVE